MRRLGVLSSCIACGARNGSPFNREFRLSAATATCCPCGLSVSVWAGLDTGCRLQIVRSDGVEPSILPAALALSYPIARLVARPSVLPHRTISVLVGRCCVPFAGLPRIHTSTEPCAAEAAKLEPEAGLEPTTCRLQGGCSTTELHRQALAVRQPDFRQRTHGTPRGRNAVGLAPTPAWLTAPAPLWGCLQAVFRLAGYLRPKGPFAHRGPSRVPLRAKLAGAYRRHPPLPARLPNDRLPMAERASFSGLPFSRVKPSILGSVVCLHRRARVALRRRAIMMVRPAVSRTTPTAGRRCGTSSAGLPPACEHVLICRS